MASPSSRAETGRSRREANLAEALRGLATRAREVEFSTLTAKDLIAASGMSRGGFYTYFRDRAAVVLALATVANIAVELRIEETGTAVGSPLDQLAFSHKTYLQFAATEPLLARVMIEHFVANYPNFETYAALTAPRHLRLAEECIASGDLPQPALVDTLRDVISGGLALTMKRLVHDDGQVHLRIGQATRELLMAAGVSAARAQSASDRVSTLESDEGWPIEEATQHAARQLIGS